MSSWSHPSRYYSSNKLRQTIARTIATHPTWKSRHLFTLHQCYPTISHRAHLLRTSSGAGAAAPSAASAVKSTPNRPENILQYINNRGDQNLATNELLQCTHCLYPTAPPIPLLYSYHITHRDSPSGASGGKKARSGVKSDNNIHPNSTTTIADEASPCNQAPYLLIRILCSGSAVVRCATGVPVWPHLYPERKPGGD